MYCSNCGYHLKEEVVDKINYSNPNRTKDSIDTFVCPRCGKIIKENLNNDEVKALARASHSEIHRSRNTINSGMAFLVISGILLSIAAMFYLMCFKAPQGGKFVVKCNEFYTFVGLLIIGTGTLVYSIVKLVLGITKNRRYVHLLRDIQNGNFYQ